MRQRMAAICKSSHFFHTEGKRRGVKTTGSRREAPSPVVINQKSNHSQTVRIGRNVPDMLWIKIVGSHVIYNGIMFQLPTIRLDR